MNQTKKEMARKIKQLEKQVRSYKDDAQRSSRWKDRNRIIQLVKQNKSLESSVATLMTQNASQLERINELELDD